MAVTRKSAIGAQQKLTPELDCFRSCPHSGPSLDSE